MTDYKVMSFFGFSGEGKTTDITSGKDSVTSFQIAAETLSRTAKNVYPSRIVFPGIKSWTYKEMFTGLLLGAATGTLGEVHVFCHGGSSLLSLAYEFDSGKRLKQRAQKFNRLEKTLGARAAALQALDEEDGLWSGTLSMFPTDPKNYRKKALNILKPSMDKAGYVHLWGCYAGASNAALSYDGDPVLDAYFKRFRLRTENPGVGRDLAMALGVPVTAVQKRKGKEEGGTLFYYRNSQGQIQALPTNRKVSGPYWMWPDANAKWVTYKPDGTLSPKIRLFSTEYDPKDVPSGKPPKFFRDLYGQ